MKDKGEAEGASPPASAPGEGAAACKPRDGARGKGLPRIPFISHPPVFILFVWICVAWGAFSWALVAQHRAYNSNAFDLGFFDQIIWNTSQGRWFETTFVEYNFLGQHVEPVLLAFAAAYRLWPNVEIMLLTQAAVAAWAALPLYLAAWRLLASATAALLVAGTYLLSPHLHGAVLFDFHPEVMAVAGIFSSFALLAAARPGWALAAFATVFLLKEDAALAGAGFALVFWLRGYRRHALALLAGSALYFVLVAGAFMSAVRGGPGDLQERYGYLGRDTGAIVVGALTHPDRIIRQLWQPSRRKSVAYLMAAQGLLPLLTPAALAAVPVLAANLLATHPPQGELTLHYAILPFALLTVASVLAIERLAGTRQTPHPGLWPARSHRGRAAREKGEPPRAFQRNEAGADGATPRFLPGSARVWVGHERAALLAALLFLSATMAWTLGSALGPRRFDAERYRRTSHHAAVERVLAAVPPGAPLSAQSGLLPHLSQRRAIWEFPRIESADHVVVDVRSWYSSQSGDAGYQQVLDTLPARGFCLLKEEDGARLYARGDACAGR